MVAGSESRRGSRRVRLGMVGGGRAAFIGAVHRMAARLDDVYELVAAALSSDPARAAASAADLGLPAARSYADFETMAAAEAMRDDGIEAVAIVTPNHLHARVARSFLAHSIDVICDKPLTATLAEAEALAEDVARAGVVFALTYNNTGHAMIRQAREMVLAGMLGEIRMVHAEYAQDWLAAPVERQGHKQAEWRVDPARSGIGGCISDIGTHAANLAAYVTDLAPIQLCAELTSFVPGRALDDSAAVLLRYQQGARGLLWASQATVGCDNALSLRVFGTSAALTWRQEQPNDLLVSELGRSPRRLTKGGPESGAAARHATRTPAGHPDGYLDAFATVYADAAELILARREGRAPDPLAETVPGIAEGLAAMRFVDAAVRSSQQGGVWTDLGHP